jgi:hypothetical protein
MSNPQIASNRSRAFQAAGFGSDSLIHVFPSGWLAPLVVSEQQALADLFRLPSSRTSQFDVA